MRQSSKNFINLAGANKGKVKLYIIELYITVVSKRIVVFKFPNRKLRANGGCLDSKRR